MDHSLFMTGGGLAKKGVGYEVFLTEKRGLPKNIGSEVGVQRLFYYSGGKFDMYDYCYCRERAR
jgi:hypothetical protein